MPFAKPETSRIIVEVDCFSKISLFDKSLKKHKENKTGSNEAYKPIKIKKSLKLKRYESWK